MNELLPDISLADMDLFVRVAKLKSLRECARQMKVTPGAVSKSIKRLETNAGAALLRRSVSGILLTSDGNDFVKLAEAILGLSENLPSRISRGRSAEKVWGIGSLSFISSRLLPPLLNATGPKRARARFRLVEFTHNQLVAQGLSGAFEIAVHIGPLEWTRIWSSHELGTLRWALYARTDHPLTKAKMVRSSDVIKFPFVMPTGWSAQGFTRGEDHCPIPWGLRHAGHEATTGETALEIVSSTDQLVFVPTVLAQRLVQGGVICEIKVADLPLVKKKVYLSVRDDLVPSWLFEHVRALIDANLSTLD